MSASPEYKKSVKPNALPHNAHYNHQFWFCLMLLLLILTGRQVSFSQSNKADSLKKLLPASEGKARTDILNRISKEYWFTNHDSSMYYAGIALSLAEQMHYDRAAAEAFRNMGMASISDTVTARRYFYKSMNGFRLDGDKKGIGDCYNNLGLMLMNTNYQAALNSFDSALAIFNEIGDKKGQGSVLNYINVVYQYLGDYQKAVDYALEGLEIRKKTDDINGIIYSYINTGDIYAEGGQLQSAIKYYNESIEFAKQHHLNPFPNSYWGLAYVYIRLGQYEEARKNIFINPSSKNYLLFGDFYFATGKPDNALIEYKKSIREPVRRGNKSELAKSYIGLAEVFLKKNNLENALQTAIHAYSIADSAGNKLTLASAADVLANVYAKKGQFREAFFYSTRSHSILDSVNNKTNEGYQHKLGTYEAKNEIDRREANLKILAAEKTLQDQKLSSERTIRNIILLGTALLLILSIIIITYINNKRKKIQAQKEQIDIQKSKVEKTLTELKKAQAQLIHQEKMSWLGELTAGVAHEIQNPLNFVNNFSELNREMMEELEAEFAKGNFSQAQEIFQNIKNNESKISHHGKRADSIVKSMLGHAQSGSGQKELRDINVLAGEFLRICIQNLKVREKDFSVEVNTYFDQSIENIPVVPKDIGKVFMNIYNNAFYAVSEKKKKNLDGYAPAVTVSTRKNDQFIEISIKDNGDGIPEQNLQKIFQPFFTTKPAGQGTGLGLSLSYDMVKAQGGEITVETREGLGSEFIVRLALI
ncbi:MAG TPA: tetratricopeptide repeat protein [Puia sp.]|nr:tetratricopeptide repeat protein [Puia sp.]